MNNIISDLWEPGGSTTRLANYLGKLGLSVLVSPIPRIEPLERSASTHLSENECPISGGLDIEIPIPIIFEVKPPRAKLAKSPQAEQAIWDEVSRQLELSNCSFSRVADLWIGPQGNLSLVGVSLQDRAFARHRPDKQEDMAGLFFLFDKPSTELMDEVDYLAKKEDKGFYYLCRTSGTVIPIIKLRRKLSCQRMSIRQLQLDP